MSRFSERLHSHTLSPRKRGRWQTPRTMSACSALMKASLLPDGPAERIQQMHNCLPPPPPTFGQTHQGVIRSVNKSTYQCWPNQQSNVISSGKLAPLILTDSEPLWPGEPICNWFDHAGGCLILPGHVAQVLHVRTRSACGDVNFTSCWLLISL